MSETAIKAEIQQALTHLGYRWYRIQCGRWKVRGGWMHGAPDGTADLFVLVRLPYYFGTKLDALWIETNSENGNLRPSQKKFRDSIVGNFEHYLLARSVDDVLRWIKEKEQRGFEEVTMPHVIINDGNTMKEWMYFKVYRLIMRVAHRFDWHYAPVSGPLSPPSADGRNWQRWCQWCGFRESFNRYPSPPEASHE